MPRRGTVYPRDPPPRAAQEPHAAVVAGMGPHLRALPRALRRWAALVAGVLSAGGAWARRVAAALRGVLLAHHPPAGMASSDARAICDLILVAEARVLSDALAETFGTASMSRGRHETPSPCFSLRDPSTPPPSSPTTPSTARGAPTATTCANQDGLIGDSSHNAQDEGRTTADPLASASSSAVPPAGRPNADTPGLQVDAPTGEPGPKSNANLAQGADSSTIPNAGQVERPPPLSAQGPGPTAAHSIQSLNPQDQARTPPAAGHGPSNDAARPQEGGDVASSSTANTAQPGLQIDHTELAARIAREPAVRKKQEASRGARKADKAKTIKAASSSSSQSQMNKGGKHWAVVKVPQDDPFEKEGCCLSALFREELDADATAVMYAVYCLKRSQKLLNKDTELCDICYFKHNAIVSEKKEKMVDHCWKIHKIEGYPCPKRGCFVRCRSLGEAGLHNFYLHEQKCKHWWRYLLEKRGMMLV